MQKIWLVVFLIGIGLLACTVPESEDSSEAPADSGTTEQTPAANANPLNGTQTTGTPAESPPTPQFVLDRIAKDCLPVHLDGEYRSETGVVAQFKQGHLLQIQDRKCQIDVPAQKSAVPEVQCPDCKVTWECAGCKITVWPNYFLSDMTWALTPFGDPKVCDSLRMQIQEPFTAGSCMYEKFCSQKSVLVEEECKQVTPGSPTTQPGGGSSDGQSACGKCIDRCSGLGIPNCCTGVGCLCEDACGF